MSWNRNVDLLKNKPEHLRSFYYNNRTLKQYTMPSLEKTHTNENTVQCRFPKNQCTSSAMKTKSHLQQCHHFYTYNTDVTGLRTAGQTVLGDAGLFRTKLIQEYFHSSKNLDISVHLTGMYCNKSGDWFTKKKGTIGYYCSSVPGLWFSMNGREVFTKISVTEIVHSTIFGNHAQKWQHSIVFYLQKPVYFY